MKIAKNTRCFDLFCSDLPDPAGESGRWGIENREVDRVRLTAKIEKAHIKVGFFLIFQSNLEARIGIDPTATALQAVWPF
jgi:hypothetical protein